MKTKYFVVALMLWTLLLPIGVGVPLAWAEGRGSAVVHEPVVVYGELVEAVIVTPPAKPAWMWGVLAGVAAVLLVVAEEDDQGSPGSPAPGILTVSGPSL